MPEKSRKNYKGKTERLEIRISSNLKEALTNYSDQNLESVMETTNRAIKKFVSFGVANPPIPVLSDDRSFPKDNRLEIRVHPELKNLLFDTQNKIELKNPDIKITISTLVISAIIQYIDYR